MNTSPILFIIFNRKDTTERVFEVIRKARPEKLYISADGPRQDRLGEKEKCDAVRAITETIDWPCEVKRLYRDTNLGCKKAVAGAITWFFEHEERGIILEDDCLPDPTFFDFATLMLEQYANDNRIFHINGSNFLTEELNKNIGTHDSYYFSKNVHVWGWATWRRAWNIYDIEMAGIEDSKIKQKILSQFNDRKIGKFWISLFTHIKNKQINTWDAQWAYAVLKSGGVCITPTQNLIENIGFGSEGTHTQAQSSFSQFSKKLSSIDTHELPNPYLEADLPIRQDLDSAVSHKLYIKSIYRKIWDKLKSVI